MKAPRRPLHGGFNAAFLLGQDRQPKLEAEKGPACRTFSTKLAFEFQQDLGKGRNVAFAYLQHTPTLDHGSAPEQAVNLQGHAFLGPIDARRHHGRLTDHPAWPRPQFQQVAATAHGGLGREHALSMRPLAHVLAPSWRPSSLRTSRDHP